MNKKQINMQVSGVDIDVDAVSRNRSRIIGLGGMLGAKYFKIGAIGVYPKFEDKKRENELNGSLDFMPNRTPRRFEVRDYDVFGQIIETDADGTTKVVFNPGTAEEAKAALIDGSANFNDTSESAIQSALSGSNVIFANGMKLVEKANDYNRNELARLDSFIRSLQDMRASIVSTIDHNTKRANAYETEILNSKPKQVPVTSGGAPTMIIEEPSSNE